MKAGNYYPWAAVATIFLSGFMVYYGLVKPKQLVAIKPRCFFVGDQWGKQEVMFFSDPNSELKKVTYTVPIDSNSPDWDTWKERYLQVRAKATKGTK